MGRTAMTITSPSQGATVKGVVTVRVDAPGVQRVQFYIDGLKKGVDQGPPFSFDWYSDRYANGRHTVKAVSGNGKQSAQVTVTVANGFTVTVSGGSKAGEKIHAAVTTP